MSSRLKPQIIAGLRQPLDETVLGARPMAEKFFERFLLINGGLLENAPFHIACHIISNLEAIPEPYAKIHCHPDHDEIGLVIGAQGALEYEMILDGKEHRVQSPAAFSIPAGTYHRAQACRRMSTPTGASPRRSSAPEGSFATSSTGARSIVPMPPPYPSRAAS